MKRISLLVFLVAILSACSSPSDYKISGKFDSNWNGQKVVLYAASPAQGLVGVDSTQIENGVFKLSGKADSVGWYVLYFYQANAQPYIQDFYLDGELSCTFQEGRIKYSGSEINNKYQDFENKYVELTKDVVHLNQQMQSNPNDVTLKNAFNKAYERFSLGFVSLARTTIISNLNNPLGYHIFEASVSTLPDNVIEEILEKADKAFLQMPLSKMVVEQFEMAKKVAIGNKCPDIKLLTPYTKRVSLSDYVGNGHYVLLDFWASWCAPCMQAVPELKEIYDTYHPKGFEIVGISLDESANAWRGAISKNKMLWPHLSDLAGWKSQAVSIFAFSSIPHTILVDPNGVIVEKGLMGEGLMKKLKEIYK
jgi:peroxiredoxin